MVPSKYFSLSCVTVCALLTFAGTAQADNEVHVQKITWVKPTQTIKAAAPTQAAPAVQESSVSPHNVRSRGTKPLHPALPKIQTATAPAPENISAVSPLFPAKPTLAQVVSRYYGISTKDVDRALEQFGYTDDALVALFMANAANTDLERIITLRQGNSWKNVIGLLQLNTKYLFQNLQVGPIPKENTRNCMSIIQYMSWREEPDFRDLGDLSVRELVGASLIANRFQTGPLEAMRQVHECGSSLAALQQYTSN